MPIVLCLLYASQFLEEYRKIWDFGRTWDAEAYSAQPRSLQEIRRDLVNQRNWKSALDKLRTQVLVGCLQVMGGARLWLHYTTY